MEIDISAYVTQSQSAGFHSTLSITVNTWGWLLQKKPVKYNCKDTMRGE